MKIIAATKPVKGAVVICHGFGEHDGSYGELTETLGRAGYAGAVYTQRGHGDLPDKQKGVISGYKAFLDDLAASIAAAREAYPSVPVMLYGHSMGGNIVTNYLLRRGQQGIACAVLESPWFGLYKKPNAVLTAAAKGLGAVSLNFAIINELTISDITSDPEKIEWIENDPLYHNRISMRMLSGILKGCAFAKKYASRLTVPVFIAFAENERVVSNAAILQFAGTAAAGTAVTLRGYESCHAIHNDVKRGVFHKDMIAFLDAQTG
jgi:alpha-beta hydrolase superfamily lysophospholipase